MASPKGTTESRTKRIHDVSNPRKDGEDEERANDERTHESHHTPPPVVNTGIIDMEGLTSKQAKDLRQTIEQLQEKWKMGDKDEGNSHLSERKSSGRKKSYSGRQGKVHILTIRLIPGYLTF